MELAKNNVSKMTYFVSSFMGVSSCISV